MGLSVEGEKIQLFEKRERQKLPQLCELPNAQQLTWHGFCCCILFSLELMNCSDVVETVLVIAPAS